MLDNRWSLARGRLHLTFDMGGKRIAYAYIRKNGCSTFKRALGFAPNADISEVAARHPFGPHDIAIFVYRDPVERMASLYKSKFVERRDAADIIADYRRVTGEEPTTFERFVGYLRKAKDPHTYDQRSHLKRLRYHPIPLGRLHQEMSQLIGAEAAEPFQHKVNQSSGDVRISPAARAAIERRYARDCRLLASLS